MAAVVPGLQDGGSSRLRARPARAVALVQCPAGPSFGGTSPQPAFGPLSTVINLPARVCTSANGLRKPGA